MIGQNCCAVCTNEVAWQSLGAIAIEMHSRLERRKRRAFRQACLGRAGHRASVVINRLVEGFKHTVTILLLLLLATYGCVHVCPHYMHVHSTLVCMLL